MKNKPILIVLTVLFFITAKAHAQDPVFTQWENMSLYFNPALTGDFDGILRFRAKYRNQWESLFKDNSYNTTAVSADYKFSTGSVRKISVGIFGTHDKAGSLNFRNKAINFSTSVTQNLSNPDSKLHSVAFGLSVGLTNRKLDLDNAQWPGGMPPADLNENIFFGDVSGGLLWQYRSKTHFGFQVGGALHHLNRPNISFTTADDNKLYRRFNLHGNVEIPLIHKFSVIPSFLLSSQGPSEQLLFGFNGRWYVNTLNQNFVQLGFFGKSTQNLYGSDINVYVLSTTVEINSFLVGFSFDRFHDIKSNAYEFSIGYIFGMPGSKGTTGDMGYSPSGVTEAHRNVEFGN